MTTIYQLAKAKARRNLEPLHPAVTAARIARWSALFAPASFTALAASLLCEDTSSHQNVDGFVPPCSEFLAHAAPSPVEEGRDLHRPHHKRIWRLASIKTVRACGLPSTTALCQLTFGGEQGAEETKKRVEPACQWRDVI